MSKSRTSNKTLVIESRAINKAGLIYRTAFHPLRLKILETVAKAGTINVSKLNSKLRQDQSIISQQLKILRDSKFLFTERVGRQIYYSVNESLVNKLQVLSNKMIPTPKVQPVSISKKELQAIRDRQPVKPKKPLFSELELEIIKMICGQKTSEEIGKALGLSRRTVDDYRQQVIRKMKMKNSAGLVLYAVRNKLFPLR